MAKCSGMKKLERTTNMEVWEKIKSGYSFIGFSLDFYFLGDKARSEMKKLKNV